MSLLDNIEKNHIDVRTLVVDIEREHQIIMFPQKTLREILIDGLSGNRVVILSSFSWDHDIERIIRIWRRFCYHIKLMPAIYDISNAVIIRDRWGSKNYVAMANEHHYESIFDEEPLEEDDSFRCYTLGVSFCTECRSLYSVIRTLYSLNSALEKRYDAKLVIQDGNKRYNYCIDLNSRFIRDIELWNSNNRSRRIKDFPYSRLFSYMSRKKHFKMKDLQKAIDQFMLWVEKCQWVDVTLR